MPKNWEARERKLDKKKTGMIVTNRSLKSVVLPVIARKAAEASEYLGENRKVGRGKRQVSNPKSDKQT